ncbi:MAG: adenylosuccinate synthetase [Acidobacteria bacterium]|nr:adenylosuccinate synthetase [Acidobacteriota bacterium]
MLSPTPTFSTLSKRSKVCVGYEIDGRRVDTFPAVSSELTKIKPIYETLSGWMSDTVGTTDFDKLPENNRMSVFYPDQIDVDGAHIDRTGTRSRRSFSKSLSWKAGSKPKLEAKL